MTKHKIIKAMKEEFKTQGWLEPETLEIIVFNPENISENITIIIDKPEITEKTTKPGLDREISKRVIDKIMNHYSWGIAGIDFTSKEKCIKTFIEQERNKD